MKNALKWIVIIILAGFILLAIHIADNILLSHLFFSKSSHNTSYLIYEKIRYILHILLWFFVLGIGVLVTLDIYKQKKIMLTWKLKLFLWLIIIAFCTELPIFPCGYAGGIYETFWKGFHFH